jgi:multiple sugar transport system ATP-binding protein
MVFQTYALYPHMTVRQNMGFSLKLAGVDRGEIERRVVDAARILDLARHLDRRPATLSGGQRQRVAMGRAIVREPSAFLMDEPLSNLDAKLRVQMRVEIARIQERLRTTTIYVTHDQIEAMTLGDRVAVMSQGVLQQVDAPEVLYGNPANLFVASFIGSPAMNFFEGELINGFVRTPIGELPLTDARRRWLEVERPSGHEVIIGIRPEHFEDARLADPQRSRFEFDAPIELTESVGSEVYAHFGYVGWAPPSRDLERLAPDDELQEAAHLASSTRAVARLSPASNVRPHEVIALSVDLEELHVFDRTDGRCLTRPPVGELSSRGSAGGAMAM